MLGRVPHPEPSSVDLLRRWYEGDADAMSLLVRRHRDWLWRYARNRLSERVRAFHTSEDVVQEVLVQLLRNGPAFLPENDLQLRALLGKIVLHRILDLAEYAGAECREPERGERFPTSVVSRIGPAEHSSNLPDRLAAAREEENRVRLAMELLEPEDRRVLLLRQYEGLPFAEVGERLGITPKAAAKRFERAVTRLGRELRRLESGDLSELTEEILPYLQT